MRKHAKRVFLWIAAIFFLLLGIAGLFLPLLQGILFIAIGLILLAIVSPSSRAWWEVHTRKFPKLHEAIVKVEKRVTDFIGLP